jgi:hypothetical protein
VTKNLWIAYAQPGYYEYLEKYYGFKRYSRLFDYKFDSIKNPIKRLIAIIEMLGKFSTLSSDEWHDLYLLEMDTIEYNYEQFYSNKWLEVLKNNKDLSD